MTSTSEKITGVFNKIKKTGNFLTTKGHHVEQHYRSGDGGLFGGGGGVEEQSLGTTDMPLQGVCQFHSPKRKILQCNSNVTQKIG
ncbi:hypothetical protein E2542_SST05385 [Spatholobus suberectus]|nr:hypothetical protein E2542_SST05385 [Spatholobus suberectus]